MSDTKQAIDIVIELRMAHDRERLTTNITTLFSRAADEIERQEKRIAELEAGRDQLRSALNLGGYDLSVCCACGTPVICVPDGLAMCSNCANQERTSQE